jgi:hypothetical protein
MPANNSSECEAGGIPSRWRQGSLEGDGDPA